jgi:hypothetical protein
LQKVFEISVVGGILGGGGVCGVSQMLVTRVVLALDKMPINPWTALPFSRLRLPIPRLLVLGEPFPPAVAESGRCL